MDLPLLLNCRWCQFQPAQQHLRSLILGILSELLGPIFTVDCQTNSLAVQHVRETFPSSFCPLRFFFHHFLRCVFFDVFFFLDASQSVTFSQQGQLKSAGARARCCREVCRTSPHPQHPAVLTQKKRKKTSISRSVPSLLVKTRFT